MHVVMDFDIFYVDAVLFCKKKQLCLFQACLSALHDTWDSLDVENCKFNSLFY